MCGIAGILSLHPEQVQIPILEQMALSLAHRGPDGQACWISRSGKAGLAHRRLSIIDLSEKAAQPMHLAGRYSIVYNGELYNYLELRKLLLSQGCRFETNSDTEVILQAFARMGPDCLKQFDGMFALAIWDEQEQRLFAARDRFGEKPFFYCINRGSFFFASEMKALWKAGIGREPDFTMLYNFLTLGYTQNPGNPYATFFHHINKLPARHYLQFEPGWDRAEVKSYWDLDPERYSDISDEEAVPQFRSLFQASVDRRLRSDVPAGTSLSGGLDSSCTLAACIRSGSSVFNYTAFTCGFPDFELDESQTAAGVAEQFNLVHHLVRPGPEELQNDFSRIAYHQEEPFSSASVFAQYKVYQLAGELGVKVLLDGQGADEVLAGYHKYYPFYWQELARFRPWRLPAERRAAAAVGVDLTWPWKNRFAALFPATAMRRAKLERKRTQELWPDLHPEFGREYGQSHYDLPRPDHLNAALYYNSLVNGLEELLRLADRNAMAFGREIRLPFLSHELVEFAFSLRAGFKIRDGFGKWILRKSMESELPPSIIWSVKKIGFEPPQEQWMQKPAVQALIRGAREILVRENILAPSVLKKEVRPHSSYAAGQADWRYWSAGVWLTQ